MTPDELTYPCPPIGIIAVAEVQRRHQAELSEVLQAARAVSDLPEGQYTLDMQKGEWVPRVTDG
jgi:hypothetical protein